MAYGSNHTKRDKPVHTRDLAAQPELAARLQTLDEHERATIARDLHDQLGQSLTIVKLGLHRLKSRSNTDALIDELDALIDIVDQTMAETKRIVSQIRPAILDHLGLAAACHWLVRQFDSASEIIIRDKIADDCDQRIDNGVAIALYRILQEALTNAVKHANASLVVVSLRLDRQRVELIVEDDGRGIETLALVEATGGIVGMIDRAASIGGDLWIDRRGAGGTRVKAVVPLGGGDENVEP